MINQKVRVSHIVPVFTCITLVPTTRRMLTTLMHLTLQNFEVELVLGKFGLKLIQTRFKPNPNHLR
jgi:hypothetical protein